MTRNSLNNSLMNRLSFFPRSSPGDEGLGVKIGGYALLIESKKERKVVRIARSDRNIARKHRRIIP